MKEILRARMKRIDRILEKLSNISVVWNYFSDIGDDSRNLYFSWLMMSIAVIISIPFIPIHFLVYMPLRWRREQIRKQLLDLRYVESD